jgi:peptidoglycan/LPS O-acetylase OafA/YrhL
MQTGNNSNLDFLRAMAVLFVLVGHLTYFRGIMRVGPLNIIPLGFWGVLVFFVHTCLVLMLSLERQWNQRGRSDLFVTFMIRRCFRIFPLSILVVALISVFNLPQATLKPGQFLGTVSTPWDIVCNLLLIQNLAKRVSILGPLWSLPYELQMYLFLPWIFLLIRPSRSIWRVVGLWLVSLGVASLALHYQWIPDLALYLPSFVPGVIAYQLMRSERFRLPAFLWPFAVAALTVFALTEVGWKYRWTAGLILGLAVPRFVPLSSRWIVVPSQLIAKYSYGIYLTHFFSIWFAFEALQPLPKLMRMLVFAACAVGLPVFFYHAVEEPMINLGKKFTDRLPLWTSGLRYAPPSAAPPE